MLLSLAERESPHWEEQERRQAVQEMLEFAGKHRFRLGEGLHITRTATIPRHQGTLRAIPSAVPPISLPRNSGRPLTS